MKKSKQPVDSQPSVKYGFETLFKADGKYYFQFNDAAGEALLFSKAYRSEKTCSDGIKTAIRLAGIKERYEVKKTKKGTCFLVLKSGNYKEIARSRMFDTLNELEQQRSLLQNIDNKVPQYGIQNNAAETTKQPLEETKRKAPTKAKKEKPTAAKKPSLIENAEEMPRYKFSTIYYPDSSIWMLRSDFSEASTKLKSLDGIKMAAFLKEQLPAKVQQTIQLETPARIEPKKKPVAVEEVAPKKPAKPQKPAKPVSTHIDLLIKTQEDQLIKRFAKSGSLAKVIISPKLKEGAPSLVFEGTVTAKSLSTKHSSIIGYVKNQGLMNGQLEIPIYAGNHLNQGLYRFLVEVSAKEAGKKARIYHSDELIKLT